MMYNLDGLYSLRTARGSVGSIGGQYSHEFLLASDLGEDIVFNCQTCELWFNKELLKSDQSVKCLSCGSDRVTQLNAIEVGHSFLLGDHYSQRFNARYVSKNTNEKL